MSDSNPIALYKSWALEAEASELNDPNAVALATATQDGKPSVRMVLLKEVTNDGEFIFYTNLESRKSKELKENPSASLCIYWKSLKVQFRVEGTVELVDPSIADKYFATRPKESQVNAWASMQSQYLGNREGLLSDVAKIKQKYENVAIPRPAHWSGFKIKAKCIEFWQEQPFRLHDRTFFERLGPEQWKISKLYP